MRASVRWSRYRPKQGSGAVALQLLSATCLVWAGVVIGVSFLATPAKFLAPTLTLSVALDIGRHTFGVLRPVEIAWATLTLVLAWLCRTRLGLRFRLGLAALWATLALELLWLVPTLDARALRMVAGETIPPTYHHVVYISLEILKLLLLLGLGWALRPGRGRSGAPASGA
jgi:hypothetical protein